MIKSPQLFPLLSPADRASCLDLILPGDEENILAFDMSPESISALSRDFTQATDGLLTTNMITCLDQLHPAQVLKMTQVLAVASGSEDFRQVLQEHRSLVLNTLYLLRISGRMLGRTGKKTDSWPEETAANWVK